MNNLFPPLEEVIARKRAWFYNEMSEQIKKIEMNRMVAGMVATIPDIQLDTSYWSPDWLSIKIRISGNPKTKRYRASLAKTLREIRVALGCPPQISGKDVYDARKKLVEIYLKPTDFPSVTISYIQPLPKGAKCKIVTHRSSYTSRNLVCEAPARTEVTCQ